VKFLAVHNTYSEITGEDLLTELLANGLRTSPEFEVVEYIRHSKTFHALPFWQKILQLVSGNLPGWVPRDFIKILEDERPDMAVIHNTVPLINPWICVALKRRRIPILFSIYDFRLLCPRGTCVRQENFCDLCFRCSPVWAIVYNCLRNPLYSVLYAYRHLCNRLFLKYTDAFICSVKYRTEFLRGLFPKNKIYFLVHYMNIDKALLKKPASKTDYIFFAGRFVEEKGIRIVLECAQRLPSIRFRVCGEGPLEGMCRRFIAEHGLQNMELLPWAPRQEIFEHLRGARLFLFPSVYLEFGLILCEAMLLKTPAVVAQNAVSRTVIRTGQNGFLFNPKDVTSLVRTIQKIWNDDALLSKVADQAYSEVSHYNEADSFIKQIHAICAEIKK